MQVSRRKKIEERDLTPRRSTVPEADYDPRLQEDDDVYDPRAYGSWQFQYDDDEPRSASV